MQIPERPALKTHLVAYVQPGVGVFLLAEDERHLLRGALYERLVPLLGGATTSDEIVDRLADAFPPEEVYYALHRLAARGHVREQAEATANGNAAHWDHLGVHPGEAARRLARTPIAVRAIAPLDLGRASAVLRAHGLHLAGEPRLVVVLATDYLDPALGVVNRRHLESARSWVLCKPVGTTLWIGPWFEPGRTSCWECLAVRLAQHRPVEAYVARARARRGLEAAPGAGAAPCEHAALGMLAGHLARAIAAEDPGSLRNRILAYDAVRHASSRHPVVHRPQCAACGDPTIYTERARAPVRVFSRPRHPLAEGGYRSAPPDETLERFGRHVDPLTGIVSELTPLRVEGASSLHAYSAGPNIALPLTDPSKLRRAATSTSTGKGTSDRQARLSALGEAIERYAGVFQGDEPRVRARLDELEGAIHPNECMHFSERQYAERRERNARASRADRIPPPFDAERATDWTPVWSLGEERPRYLPTMLLYYGYPAPEEERFCRPVANGVAAGNSREEAILHAILELIERDCVATWWYNRIGRPAAATGDALGRYGRRLTDEYRALGREWWALDLSHDLGVPCFAAITRRFDGPSEEILLGLGAHLDARLALRRAVTEMNQVLALRLNAKDLSSFASDLEMWVREGRVADHPHLLPSGGPPTHPADASRPRSSDLRDELEWCRERLEGRGMEVLVLDQTRPDIEVPVVRVVVPSLRSFRVRTAPGRLFDVPVEMGWLPRARAEGELNPIPFFL